MSESLSLWSKIWGWTKKKWEVVVGFIVGLITLMTVMMRSQQQKKVLEAANNNDLSPLKKLIKVLETPYEKLQENIEYQSPAPMGNKKYQTFCGT